ncbi:amine oxidase [Byssothecium circinans]|uniref:Amine oxidase n=1 Tax=Byssothecium circinans TaxID=147558 RepID=A0A6A5TEN9_9PLEO|nr:amine oxidase [Byssothecium circinans]
MPALKTFLAGALLLLLIISAEPIRKAQVAVLGGGMAGIMAAKQLHDAGIHDFIIVETNDRIGGRVWAHDFGSDTTPSSREAYKVELGANWVHGDQSGNRPPNPIWTLANKYSLKMSVSDCANSTVYDESGRVDNETKRALYKEFSDAFKGVETDAMAALASGVPDKSMRVALAEKGWDPKGDPLKMAMEWTGIDWELAQSASPPHLPHPLPLPLTSNQISTHKYFSPKNHFVLGPPTYASLISELAKSFLAHNTTHITDPRLLLNHHVHKINTSSPTSVTIHTKHAGAEITIQASQVITTFSAGVLQHTGPNALTWTPALPAWKTDAIATVKMGGYTKIFMQWRPGDVFWPTDTQYFLHASAKRGYYPIFQNLDVAGFHPGSRILFVTVTGDESLRVDRQTDEDTQTEILNVLRTMFPEKRVPPPEHFFYPRWSMYPWARGSYSNVPPGMSLRMRQNLRANVGRVWFAGEHTSVNWFGFLHGAYDEGEDVGKRVAARVKGGDVGLGRDMRRYERVSGGTRWEDWNGGNGYRVDVTGLVSEARDGEGRNGTVRN